MSEETKATPLPDHHDRATAIGTFYRNLVVTAGAGTGKTTLLVDRLVHLLLRNPDPLKITEIVALTFTNKAADEMRQRLRERLHVLQDVDPGTAPSSAATANAQQAVTGLLARYQLSKDELDSRIRDALHAMDRSDIGTIHSFAATLLRLYPLEAGIDPQFREDDGKAFDRLFDELWDGWLDTELTLQSAHREDWRKILPRCNLEAVKALARSLAAETVTLDQTESQSETMPKPLLEWLDNAASRAGDLIARHPEDRNNEKIVRASLAIITGFITAGRLPQPPASEMTETLQKTLSDKLKGWNDEDFSAAQALHRLAKGLINVDADLMTLISRLLRPFAQFFRDRFIAEGHMSFDGLLVRARDLVRDQRRVRNELKRRYRSILIDEFQDTDPIQYEILLYLAEQPSESARDWRQVKLTAGKLFVVGDPKQSIYAFRRADIEAYLEVVEKIIKAQDGIECRLTTNFRSNKEILDSVNDTFAALMRPQAGLQPPYIAIYPAPGRVTNRKALPKFVLRKIVTRLEKVTAETARRAEGESLARWLSEEIIGKAKIIGVDGGFAPARPKDVAILMRKLTDVRDYLEPLRRQGIRYVVEGERQFYAAKEIVDAVNLLRAVENPHDRLALVGVLRSHLGGLTDEDIYLLHQQQRLDYRLADQLHAPTSPPPLAQFYRLLTRLHEETRMMPVGAAVAHVFDSLPVEPLAACYFHGEQAVANLAKLRQQADALGSDATITLKEAIRQLEKRVVEVTEEGESALAEESVDAVRVMSIHKSKGLEFPIVVLAGCHAGVDGRRNVAAAAMFDWSTGLTGLSIGPTTDLAGLYIAEKFRQRQAEEQVRLFYVAMTRAREQLVLSCAPTSQHHRGSFFEMLDEVTHGSIGAADTSQTIDLANATLTIEVLHEELGSPQRPRSKRRKTDTDWEGFHGTWERRRMDAANAQQSRCFITPTSLKREEEELVEFSQPRGPGPEHASPPLVIGDLAHRFLQHWNFAADRGDFSAQLAVITDRWMPAESRRHQSDIEADLHSMFTIFFASAVYRTLATATILGREVPFVMPWGEQIMEGVIDIIYEYNGLLYLADYKTDRIKESAVAASVERYRQQASIYTEAASRCLQRKVAGFKLIFLRLGQMIEVVVENQQGELFT